MTAEKYLIVAAEDNEADVFLIREALEHRKLACDLAVFDNGEAVVEFIDTLDRGEARVPDVILLDLNMPRKSGDEVMRHLRRSARCSSVPVVVVTSSDSPKDRDRAAKLGVSAYFHKPVELDKFLELGGLVKDLLEGRPVTQTQG